METILTIKPGTALIGKVQAGEHECEIAEGKMIGGQISFTMKIGRGTVRYAGEVSANEMKLNVVGAQGDQYKLVCTRK